MNKILFLLLFPFFVIAQSDKNTCATLTQINKLIQEKHYNPKPIDDSLSVYVFNSFLKNIDSDNSLFLNAEIIDLKKHKFRIDNYIIAEKCNFLDDFYKSYTKAISRNQKIIESVIKEPIVYSSNENIRFYKKSLPYKNNEIELKKRFKKGLLFEVLTEIAQTSKNKDSIIKSFKQIAEVSKNKILDNYNCETENKNLTIEQFNSIFINAFCSYFDPHTVCFSNTEKSNFLSGLSSTNYSFGMDVQINEKKQLSIAAIVPYGAAYFSNKIEVDDIIQKIKVNDKEYSMNCNNYQETDGVLNSNETKKATFTFRKKSGEIYSVELFKQLMRDYQNSVYSYILEYENKRTGYIKIPSFYSKFENGKTNMSDDFKKEILKLKNEKITNLIIDLENNSGGSMQEAITLCGFFISAPAVGQQKSANNLQFVIGNENKKPIFNGSIIILINGYSASASEFFTNAMQDYNMAIVVGSKSFGKASIQEIFEIENEANDFLKITTGTFYRVTGKSHQKVGITPSITIPTIFEEQLDSEKKSIRALKNETMKGYIESNSYPLNENQKKVIKQYNLQAEKNVTFQKISILKKRVNKLFGENLIPVTLNFNSVFNYLNTYNELWNDINTFVKIENNLTIFNSGFDADKPNKNESLSKSNKIGIKNLMTNVRIIESLKIFSNLN